MPRISLSIFSFPLCTLYFQAGSLASNGRVWCLVAPGLHSPYFCNYNRKRDIVWARNSSVRFWFTWIRACTHPWTKLSGQRLGAYIWGWRIGPDCSPLPPTWNPREKDSFPQGERLLPREKKYQLPFSCYSQGFCGPYITISTYN